MSSIDELDARLLETLADEPRIGVMELARRLGVARGTAQARLDRLQATGVVTAFGPDIDPAALGYEVCAFVTVEIHQGRLPDVVAHLRAIPQVTEVMATTGVGDLHVRVVARSNADLQAVINAMVTMDGIARTSTVVATTTEVPYRTLPLARHVADESGGGTGRARPKALLGDGDDGARD